MGTIAQQLSLTLVIITMAEIKTAVEKKNNNFH